MNNSRRNFIKTLAVSAGASSVAGLGAAGCVSTPVEVGPKVGPATLNPRFPQSVMSGEPRASSVVLWTRVLPEQAGDTELTLQVASDENFANLLVNQSLDVLAQHDHCIKVRVTDLSADTRYFYRFIYQLDANTAQASNTGRTRTAPASDSDRAVKFAYVSCQDYIGRYYNSYLRLLQEDDLDFVVHLGDYIYETTGDADFQNIDGERKISFTDSAGALQIGSSESGFQAAQSVSNYRELYQTYRSDRVLQRVHECFPVIAIWDDHEFSDDCWGINATYTNGGETEEQLQRRLNAEKAYFEYMPIDLEAARGQAANNTSVLSTASEELYPNTHIYRDFNFGQNLHLVATDFRSFRPDHLIAEDAFPGKLLLDQATFSAYLSSQGVDFEARKARYPKYIDLSQAPYSAQKPALLQALTQAYSDAISASGTQADAPAITARAQAMASEGLADYITVAGYNGLAEALGFELIDEETAELPIGLAYSSLGKTGLLGEIGSRYFVIKENYDYYADYVYNTLGNKASQRAYGDAQEAWMEQSFDNANTTWKVLASSVSFSPLLVNLDLPVVPDAFRWRFYINVDHWDGFPNYKQELLEGVLARNNVVSIAGDIHSAYISQHQVEGSDNKVIDFTSTSISSGTMGQFIEDAVNRSDTLSALKPFLALLENVVRVSPERDLDFIDMKKHGVAIMTAASDQMQVAYHLLPPTYQGQPMITAEHYNNPANVIAAMNANTTRFRVDAQTRELTKI